MMKITPKQVERVHRLARELCANCDENGNCNLLDDGEAHRCVQLISIYGIYCNYFKEAVLPSDRELYEQIKKINKSKQEKEKCKMKKFNEMYVIGIDHGYGNMKTANCCFSTGVMKSDTEPTFVGDLLVWNGKYYSIGVGHKEFTADKFNDEDYHVLTLAAIARELRRERITDAAVFIAAGLPLTWVSEQKAEFKKYLLQHSEVSFTFRNTEYRIKIVGAEIYPQGFAAVAEKLGDFKGVNMLCDIGNGTMNLLRIVNKKPDAQRMFTEKYGTHQCALLIREQMMKLHHAALDDTIITEILKKGTADIDGQYLETVIKTAKEYTTGIFRRLREHEYDPKLMKLYVVGGGGCLIRNFADYDATRVIINEDICATAKGYEYMALVTLNRNVGAV